MYATNEGRAKVCRTNIQSCQQELGEDTGGWPDSEWQSRCRVARSAFIFVFHFLVYVFGRWQLGCNVNPIKGTISWVWFIPYVNRLVQIMVATGIFEMNLIYLLILKMHHLSVVTTLLDKNNEKIKHYRCVSWKTRQARFEACMSLNKNECWLIMRLLSRHCNLRYSNCTILKVRLKVLNRIDKNIFKILNIADFSIFPVTGQIITDALHTSFK